MNVVCSSSRYTDGVLPAIKLNYQFLQ